MPFESPKQRRFIYAKANEGKAWAKSFISHSREGALSRRIQRRKKPIKYKNLGD